MENICSYFVLSSGASACLYSFASKDDRAGGIQKALGLVPLAGEGVLSKVQRGEVYGKHWLIEIEVLTPSYNQYTEQDNWLLGQQ